MTIRIHHGAIVSRSPSSGRHRSRSVAVAAVVGRQVVRIVLVPNRVHPAVAVHMIVVSASHAVRVHSALKSVIHRHVPSKSRRLVVAAEAEVSSSAIVMIAAVEPDATQVDRHVNLVARVSIPSIKPNLIELRVHLLGPNLAHQAVSLNLVAISAVDEQLSDMVQALHSALSLSVSKISDLVSRHTQCRDHHH